MTPLSELKNCRAAVSRVSGPGAAIFAALGLVRGVSVEVSGGDPAVLSFLGRRFAVRRESLAGIEAVTQRRSPFMRK